MTRTNSSIAIEGVIATIKCKSTKNIKTLWIEKAEDPRLIVFNNKVYIYIQKPFILDGKIIDTDIFLVDANSGSHHKLISPFGYSGKNWIAYEENQSLFLVYSLQPLVILQVPAGQINNETVFMTQFSGPNLAQLSWGDDLGIFGEIRGGTSFLKIDDYYVAFTHITPRGASKTDHSLGFLVLNTDSLIAKHIPLTSQMKGRLYDPYGLNLKGDKIEVHISCSINIPDLNPMPVASITATFWISDLIKAVIEKGSILNSK
jgi:hypothetical protein